MVNTALRCCSFKFSYALSNKARLAARYRSCNDIILCKPSFLLSPQGAGATLNATPDEWAILSLLILILVVLVLIVLILIVLILIVLLLVVLILIALLLVVLILVIRHNGWPFLSGALLLYNCNPKITITVWPIPLDLIQNRIDDQRNRYFALISSRMEVRAVQNSITRMT